MNNIWSFSCKPMLFLGQWSPKVNSLGVNGKHKKKKTKNFSTIFQIKDQSIKRTPAGF